MSRRPALAFVLLTLVPLAAGCGSGSPSVAGTSTTATPNAAFAFARCMRAHGIPRWPDPERGGGFDKARIRALGVSGVRIKAVEQSACGRYLPGPSPQQTAQQQRTRLADGLSFARCMRHHGASRFPDPTAQGQLTVEMVQAQGIDVHSTTILRVVQTCLPASHGALTPAMVERALRDAPR
jgi:hypothetical protein